MATNPKPDFLAILLRLAEHEVKFIVVGGICAVLHGAPIATFDLDVVHSRAPRNIDRLLAALETLEAHYRMRGAQSRAPERSHLASPGHQLLMTCFGPLDLLGVIGAGHDYDNLLGESVEMEIASRSRVRVLSLPALIKVKEETVRERDKAVLSILRRTLEEKRGS